MQLPEKRNRDEEKRGMDRRRTDVETALTVSDQVLDANYCESGRVACEESARVVRYYSPPADSLKVYSLFTFSRVSFHCAYLLECERCGIFANSTPIFFQK